jgi:hypothetical protein
MGPAEHEERSPGSIDPSGIWRLLFWLTYVLGNLVLLFSFLLAMVPGRPDFLSEYLIRSTIAGLMLTSILMARWIWRIKNLLSGRGAASAMRIVVFVAWSELAFALYLIIYLAIFQFVRHNR